MSNIQSGILWHMKVYFVFTTIMYSNALPPNLEMFLVTCKAPENQYQGDSHEIAICHVCKDLID